MYENSNVPRCKSAKEANVTMATFEEGLKDYRLNVFGCQVPCNQTIFHMEYTLFHQNSDLVLLNEDPKVEDSHELIVSVFFRSLIVEEHIETIVYDWINFLSAVGGNLGLLLGFSCLSTLLHFHDVVFHKILR
jgi:hypothetical protein